MQSKIKILAIDSEDVILKSIRKALKSNENIDYEITTCDTAVEGLKLVRSNSFDIILVDLILPGMSGIEVLRRVKNISPAVSVIIMSGYLPDTASTEETTQNADGFLLKPFTSEELRSVLLHTAKQETKSWI